MPIGPMLAIGASKLASQSITLHSQTCCSGLSQLKMATASPLALLRECIRNNRSVELKDSNNQVVRSVADAQVIVLGDVSLPRTTATNFKKSSSQSEFYTLDTLIFLYLSSELDNSTYIRECRDKSIDNVAIIDRRRALDYLTGKVETVPNVVEPSGGNVAAARKALFMLVLMVLVQRNGRPAKWSTRERRRAQSESRWRPRPKTVTMSILSRRFLRRNDRSRRKSPF
jgi:hypothetical protein